MDRPNVNISQFIEEIVEWIVHEIKLKYVPRHPEVKKEKPILSPAVKNCILSIGKIMYERYENHIENLLSDLLSGNCELYMTLLGQYMFNQIEFSWSLFSVFLTFLCILCSKSFKNEDVQLTDDLMSSSTMLIEKMLSQYTGKEGWRAFELACEKNVLKLEGRALDEKLEHWKAMPSEEQKKFASEVKKASESLQPSPEKQSASEPHFYDAREMPCNTVTDGRSYTDLIMHSMVSSIKASIKFRSITSNMKTD